jgi:hypothetical protein
MGRGRQFWPEKLIGFIFFSFISVLFSIYFLFSHFHLEFKFKLGFRFQIQLSAHTKLEHEGNIILYILLIFKQTLLIITQHIVLFKENIILDVKFN